VDQETPKQLFRTAGYRVCGERAVRVDILERLADLVRPALAWRETSPGVKPDGAVDGRSFTVTGAMTSLTGASGEDFSSILRALGYRMDRKPKPAEGAPASGPPVAESPATSADLLPAVETIAAAAEAPAAAAEPSAEHVQAAVPEPVIAQSQTNEAQSEPAAADAANPAEPALEAPKPEELAFIEVWRPGGRSERHRPRRPQRAKAAVPQAASNAETGEVPVAGEASVATEASTAPATGTGEPSSGTGPERPERKDRSQRQDRHERQQRVERQNQRNDRQDRSQRRDRPPRRDKGDRVERAEREQYYAKPFNKGGGAKQADPNSPFAKLAALKQQLEQNKDRP
jgi:ATP-dependent RNA helicase SUPV3L1/SUV3